MEKIELNLDTLNDLNLDGKPPTYETEFEFVVEDGKLYVTYDAMTFAEFVEDCDDEDASEEETQQMLDGVLMGLIVPVFQEIEDFKTEVAPFEGGGWDTQVDPQLVTVGSTSYHVKVLMSIHW